MSNEPNTDPVRNKTVKNMARANGAYLIARLFLGGTLLIVGLNAFFGYLPTMSFSPGASVLIQAFEESGYLFTFIKVIEVICGLMLVGNIFVPLVMFFVAPILVNILLFGIFLEPTTLVLTAFMLLSYAVLIYYYRRFFGEILRYILDLDPNSPENFSLTKENLIESGIRRTHHQRGHGSKA